jgi:hypothetical protein
MATSLNICGLITSLQPPNPRLQRTPSAAPPSPLSRKPLGGTKGQNG